MNADEAILKARATVPRNDDGGFDEKKVLDEAVKLVKVDLDTAKRVEVKKALARQQRPGSTPPDGQLTLPGMGSYAYEPQRLIADNDGHIIEQARATIDYKQAEVGRAERNEERIRAHRLRKRRETDDYSRWVIEQLQGGRKQKELTFDTFVREVGIWSTGEAPPEPGDDPPEDPS